MKLQSGWKALYTTLAISSQYNVQRIYKLQFAGSAAERCDFLQYLLTAGATVHCRKGAIASKTGRATHSLTAAVHTDIYTNVTPGCCPATAAQGSQAKLPTRACWNTPPCAPQSCWETRAAGDEFGHLHTHGEGVGSTIASLRSASYMAAAI